MRLRHLLVLCVALAFGQALPVEATPLAVSSQAAQDKRAVDLAATLEANGLMATPAEIAAWEARAAESTGDIRIEMLRRISVEALTASDMPRAQRWMKLYAEEIRLRRDTRHARALLHLKAYERGIEGDFGDAAAELTRLLAGEPDPFLRATGGRLLAYALTDAGLPVQALQVIRSALLDADQSSGVAALKMGLADAGAYASRELGDLPAFLDNVDLQIRVSPGTMQPLDGRTALYNMAILTSSLGRDALATQLMQQFQRLSVATGNEIEIGWANELCATVLSRARAFDEALTCAQDALANPGIAPDHRPKVMLIEVAALARMGRSGEARRRYEGLRALADRRGDPLLLHDILQGEAEVLRSEGRLAQAYEVLLRFHEEQLRDTNAAAVDGLHNMRSSLEGEINDTQALLKAQRRQTLQITALVGFVALALIAAIASLLAQRRLQKRLRAAADRAERADRVKSEFRANMSHEIRTPLTSIVGFSRLLSEQPELSAVSSGFATRIVTATQSLLAIVNEVLDFSKIEAGQARIDPRPVDPRALIVDVAGLFDAQAAEKGLTVALEVSDTLPDWIVTDPDRLRQILLNLIGNAVKFTSVGAVTVAADWSGDAGLRISVEDSGPGISPDGQARLFRRFSQVDRASNRLEGGTGLGLAICSGLVDAMGGEIGVKSTEGQGSLFWFRLPAPAADTPEPTAPLPAARPAGSLSDLARILVVDDNEANRELVKLLLAALDLDITYAVDGEEAVEAAATTPFELILMDIRMPGMGGEAAMHTIRAGAGPNAQAPILAFTADVDGQATERLLGAGFDGHIPKPIDPRALLTAVVQWTSAA